MTILTGADFGRRVSHVLRGASAAIFGVTLGLTAPAALAQTITLQEGYDLMLSSELELQSLGIEASIAEEIVLQARAQRFPRVSLSLTYDTIRQEVLSSDNTTFQRADSEFPRTVAALTIVQPLFDQVRFRAMGLAQAQQAVVSAEAEVVKGEITRQYVAAFLSVVAAQLDVDRAQAVLIAREQFQSALELQVESGRGNPIDVTRAEGDSFAAQSDLADADLRLSDALFELYRYTGPEVERVVANGRELAAVNASNFDTTFSEEALLAASPEAQLARAQLAVAERELLQARSARTPVANLNLSARQEITDGSLFGGGSDIVTTEAGISVNWAIYEGGARRAAMREAMKRVELAQLRISQAENLVSRRLGALKEAIASSRQRESAIAAQAERAEQAYQEALAQEEAGTVGVEVSLENNLRAQLLRIDQNAARLRTLQLEAELLGMFGALDTDGLAARLAG
jgi:outer membrane protein